VEYVIEITNFNVRVGPTASDGKTFDVAVNCVVSDHEIAVVKALSPEVKFTTAHRNALKRAILSLGFRYDWKSKRKELGMNLAKEKIHHPSEAKSDEDHIGFVVHALSQMGYTVTKEGPEHYKPSNISVSRTDHDDGSFTLSMSLKVTPVHPEQPSQ
jgi:hypothetical protein